MAAIGRRRAILLLGGALAAGHLRADDSAEVHAVVGAIAEALSSGDATEAMSSFSKKYADYDKLSKYFEALAAAYSVTSQVDFTDEETSSGVSTVKLHWALNLATRQSGFTENRTAELTLKLMPEGKYWRIREFGPIYIFDPQAS